jgi:hypothetical protein
MKNSESHTPFQNAIRAAMLAGQRNATDDDRILFTAFLHLQDPAIYEFELYLAMKANWQTIDHIAALTHLFAINPHYMEKVPELAADVEQYARKFQECVRKVY